MQNHENKSQLSRAINYYQVVQELPGHIDHLNCLAFDLDGHFLFSGDAGGVVRMWESPEPTAPLGSSTESYSFNSPSLQGSWRLKYHQMLSNIIKHYQTLLYLQILSNNIKYYLRSKREYRVEGEGMQAHSICSLSPHPGVI